LQGDVVNELIPVDSCDHSQQPEPEAYGARVQLRLRICAAVRPLRARGG